MRHIRLACLAAVVLTSALITAPDVARAQDGWRYLPLGDGHSWTYHRQHPTMRFAPTTGRVDRTLGRGIYHLDAEALPVAGSALWVGFGGDTLYAWSFERGRWVRFIDFGAATGTQWQADLGIDGLRALTITVRDTNATVQSAALGRAVGGCFELQVRRGNAQTTETWTFAPYVGLIRWVVPTGGFDLVGELASARIWGRRLGPIDFTTLDAGMSSRYFPSDDELVLVFNSDASWQRFWAEHAPGTAAPRIDFTSKTVLVAIAGGRFGPRRVHFESIVWNFPWTTARVRVVETDATDVASAATTWPFAIAVLDGKVSRVSREWRQP